MSRQEAWPYPRGETGHMRDDHSHQSNTLNGGTYRVMRVIGGIFRIFVLQYFLFCFLVIEHLLPKEKNVYITREVFGSDILHGYKTWLLRAD